MPKQNIRTVERIQFWLDALRTPGEVARIQEMKSRLVAARADHLDQEASVYETRPDKACHPGE
jgi:hypothetical protein